MRNTHTQPHRHTGLPYIHNPSIITSHWTVLTVGLGGFLNGPYSQAPRAIKLILGLHPFCWLFFYSEVQWSRRKRLDQLLFSRMQLLYKFQLTLLHRRMTLNVSGKPFRVPVVVPSHMCTEAVDPVGSGSKWQMLNGPLDVQVTSTWSRLPFSTSAGDQSPDLLPWACLLVQNETWLL